MSPRGLAEALRISIAFRASLALAEGRLILHAEAMKL